MVPFATLLFMRELHILFIRELHILLYGGVFIVLCPSLTEQMPWYNDTPKNSKFGLNSQEMVCNPHLEVGLILKKI